MFHNKSSKVKWYYISYIDIIGEGGSLSKQCYVFQIVENFHHWKKGWRIFILSLQTHRFWRWVMAQVDALVQCTIWHVWSNWFFFSKFMWCKFKIKIDIYRLYSASWITQRTFWISCKNIYTDKNSASLLYLLVFEESVSLSRTIWLWKLQGLRLFHLKWRHPYTLWHHSLKDLHLTQLTWLRIKVGRPPLISCLKLLQDYFVFI